MQLLPLALPLLSPAAPMSAEDSLPSVLVTPGFSSTLPPWLQALKWFPKLDSSQLAQPQASHIAAWFMKQHHFLFNS